MKQIIYITIFNFFFLYRINIKTKKKEQNSKLNNYLLFITYPEFIQNLIRRSLRSKNLNSLIISFSYAKNEMIVPRIAP